MGLPLRVIRMNYMDAEGSMIYTLDVTEDFDLETHACFAEKFVHGSFQQGAFLAVVPVGQRGGTVGRGLRGIITDAGYPGKKSRTTFLLTAVQIHTTIINTYFVE